MKKGNVEKALKEGRLKFYRNGSYSYVPSLEYKTRNNTKTVENTSKVIKDSIHKLDRIAYAFSVAEKTSKKVSHVSNGKIILI